MKPKKVIGAIIAGAGLLLMIPSFGRPLGHLGVVVLVVGLAIYKAQA